MEATLSKPTAPSAPAPHAAFAAPGQPVRELVCWTAAQRAQISATLQAVHAAWRADWCLPEPTRTGDAPARLGDAQAQRALAAQMFGLPRSTAQGRTGMAASVVDEAWCDLQARLGAAIGHAHRTAGDEPAGPWSGTLDIALAWWDGEWTVRLDAPAVRQMLGALPGAAQPPQSSLPPGPLATVAAALGNQLLEVQVHFPPVTLTLGDIRSLREGDVIPLAQHIHKPATLLLAPAPGAPLVPVCAAWLGQQHGRMAAELARTEQ